MRKHLVKFHTHIVSPGDLLNMSGWEYWSKRLKVWKWRKHRTMGRPVLLLRRLGDD